jgi:hypothetical protein
MRRLRHALTVGIFVTLVAQPMFAATNNYSVRLFMAGSVSTQDQAKADLYQKFLDNRKGGPAEQKIAYETASVYVQKYAADNDKIIEYLRNWMTLYEKAALQFQLSKLIFESKDYSAAFSLGKQALAKDPDNLTPLIQLGYAGYLAAAGKDVSHNTDAAAYIRKAMQLIESGKAPAAWAPFKDKDDSLAYLYFSLGFLTLKETPDEVASFFAKAAQFNSEVKSTASTYYYLGAAYETGSYVNLSEDYNARFGRKVETEQSKQALEKLNAIIDRIIVAYARAVAVSGNDQRNEQIKSASMERLKAHYRFRHNDSEAGLSEFISSVLSRPLPSAN